MSPVSNLSTTGCGSESPPNVYCFGQLLLKIFKFCARPRVPQTEKTQHFAILSTAMNDNGDTTPSCTQQSTTLKQRQFMVQEKTCLVQRIKKRINLILTWLVSRKLVAMPTYITSGI